MEGRINVNLPSVPLKIVVSVHFILTIWGDQIGWLPGTYLFCNLLVLALGVWAIAVPENSDATQLEKVILLDLNDIKKVAINVKDSTKKKDLIERVFGIAVEENSTVSLQRFDVEWGEFVDVTIKELKDRDKVKVKILQSISYTRKVPPSYQTQPQTSTNNNFCATSTPVTSSHGGEKAIDRMIHNLEEHRSTLEYRCQVAQATLSSLREKPREREPAGRNVAFTCSNCHYRGHRVNNCRQPPCQGFFECGVSVLHKDYKEQLKKAEIEVREVTKLLKDNKDEIENTRLLKERTKSNFFSVVRQRLQQCNPIKYSNRVCLDNDLRVLAAACKHKVPAYGVNLEEIIENYQRDASNLKSMESTVNENRRWYNSQRTGEYNSGLHNHYNQRAADVDINRGGSPGSWQTSPQPYSWRSPTERPFRWQSPHSRYDQQIPHFPAARSRGFSSGGSPGWRGPSRQNTNWQGRSARCTPSNYSLGRPNYTQDRREMTETTRASSFSKKKLTYKKPSNDKEPPGKKFRALLKERATSVPSDSETQDESDDSPSKIVIPSSGGKGIDTQTHKASSEHTEVAQRDVVNEEAMTLSCQESQSFDFETWAGNQTLICKQIQDGDDSQAT